MKKKASNDLLKEAKSQLKRYINENYSTVEEFCWDRGLNKATVSNLLNDKKDFRVSTLEKIAKAIGKEVSIRFK